jgi:thymidylate synthase (FAD)
LDAAADPDGTAAQRESDMSEIRYRSDCSVKLAQHVGTDADFAWAAWAKFPASDDSRHTPDGWRRVIRTCIRKKHNTPLEHGLMSVYVEAPGVVWWQLTRQRFMSLDSEDFSFNMESGRYRHLDPEFYLPPVGRPCSEPDGFKPMVPQLTDSEVHHELASKSIEYQARDSWTRYASMINYGVAREVARLCLPNWSLYCDGYVTAKPLTWLQFFSKRNRTDDTAIPTFPQYEIESLARQCEDLFAGLWPITHSEFVQNGRQAP